MKLTTPATASEPYNAEAPSFTTSIRSIAMVGTNALILVDALPRPLYQDGTWRRPFTSGNVAPLLGCASSCSYGHQRPRPGKSPHGCEPEFKASMRSLPPRPQHQYLQCQLRSLPKAETANRRATRQIRPVTTTSSIAASSSAAITCEPGAIASNALANSILDFLTLFLSSRLVAGTVSSLNPLV